MKPRFLVLPLLLAACQVSGAPEAAPLPPLQVQLLGAWDGVSVPAGQQCPTFGGNGASPPMRVTGLPEGTVEVIAEFNDLSYGPLARNGGHGTLGVPARGTRAEFPAVPGMTRSMPEGVRLVAASRGRSPGYMPPCSGGQRNRYEATVYAVDAAGNRLAQSRVPIGRY